MRQLRCLTLFLLALILVSAVSAAELFSPGHVVKLKRVTTAAISPDGQHVAYGLAVQRHPLKDEDGPASVELHVADASGNSRAFVTGEVNVSQPHWTPDGKQIAYISKRGDDRSSALYVIPIDGGESSKLIEHGSSSSGVSFCRADSRIAFLATPKKA